MSETAKHTAGPWVSSGQFVKAPDGRILAECHMPTADQSGATNSAFIVRACNCFEEMLEALKAADKEGAFFEIGTDAKIKSVIAKAEGRA